MHNDTTPRGSIERLSKLDEQHIINYSRFGIKMSYLASHTSSHLPTTETACEETKSQGRLSTRATNRKARSFIVCDCTTRQHQADQKLDPAMFIVRRSIWPRMGGGCDH